LAFVVGIIALMLYPAIYSHFDGKNKEVQPMTQLQRLAQVNAVVTFSGSAAYVLTLVVNGWTSGVAAFSKLNESIEPM
jgi:hypothetical protein